MTALVLIGKSSTAMMCVSLLVGGEDDEGYNAGPCGDLQHFGVVVTGDNEEKPDGCP